MYPLVLSTSVRLPYMELQTAWKLRMKDMWLLCMINRNIITLYEYSTPVCQSNACLLASILSIYPLKTDCFTSKV